MKKNYIILFLVALFSFTGCDLDPDSADLATIDNLLSEDEGALVATNGNYALFKERLEFRGQAPSGVNSYMRHLYQMSEFASDNVMIVKSTPDALIYCFTRAHFPTQENSAYFWFIAYKIILGANLIIDALPEGLDAETDQVLGENYFIRAMVTFDLLKFYARTYSHGTDFPGVLLKTSVNDPSIQARATVGESYEQVEEDLLKAEALMTGEQSRGVEYGSQLAAQAMLSRLYLYMENNDKCIEYSDKVIGGSVSLASNAEYLNNFANTDGSPESIFIVKYQTGTADDIGKFGAIGSMYYEDGSDRGWGEVFPSDSYMDLIQQHPEDIRNDIIVITGENYNNGEYPIRYVTKFSGQDDITNLASPQILRLSEVYLNRAEAYAKTNNESGALDDVNTIRARAGLSGSALYTTSNLGSKSVLDVVLEERRLELAFEGHRPFDLLRNKIDLDRDYPGFRLNPDESTTTPWDDDRGIYYIPLAEISQNPDCEQNP